MTRTRWASVGLGLGLLAGSGAIGAGAAEPGEAERAAIFGAAGFKAKGGKYVRCEDDVAMSYMPGRIEMEDVNGDGRADAWVKESSLYCYGNTAEFFVLLTQDAKGAWIAILEDVGVPTRLETRSHGWPDIESGGPGFGKFPVHRYDGTKYVPKG